MVALNPFDARQYEPNRPFEPLPDGTYLVTITDSNQKPTKSGGGAWYLELEMTVQEGPHRGRRIFDRLNLENPSEKAVEIAHRTLSAICHVCGVMELHDSVQLHGRPFVAVVRLVPRSDGSGIMSNEIRGYRNQDGSEVGFSGRPAQPQATPSWGRQAEPLPGWDPPVAPSAPSAFSAGTPPFPPSPAAQSAPPSVAYPAPPAAPAAAPGNGGSSAGKAAMKAPNAPWSRV